VTWLGDANISEFRPYLVGIGSRLEPNAMVYLLSCRVGGTDPGRRLLMALSNVWPNRRVVGFVEEGHQQPGPQWSPGARCEMPGVQFGESNQWADWRLPGAVVAQHGRIL